MYLLDTNIISELRKRDRAISDFVPACLSVGAEKISFFNKAPQIQTLE